jgi:hypothetical protein
MSQQNNISLLNGRCRFLHVKTAMNNTAFTWTVDIKPFLLRPVYKLESEFKSVIFRIIISYSMVTGFSLSYEFIRIENYPCVILIKT